MVNFWSVALLFFIYSFCGWCIEVAFVAVTVGKVENRGFLNGPICPIYGCGMLSVLAILLPVKDKWYLLFLGGMLICSVVECLGGWILDKIFHMRWWDYSDKPFNLGGYICLGFSIMWGIGVLFAVKIAHPLIWSVVKHLPNWVKITLVCVFIAVFIADMVVTLKNLIGIKKNLGQLDKLAEELHNIGDDLKEVVGNSAITVAEKAEERMDKLEAKEKLENLSEAAKERIDNAEENAREKFNARMEELEAKREELIENIRKHNKHTLNALPKLNKSGKSINIKEYINSLKRK